MPLSTIQHYLKFVRDLVFSGYSGFLRQQNWPPQI